MNETNINDIVKVLAELVVEDKELFLKFIRRLACEENQDKIKPVACVPPTERKAP